MAQVLWPNFPAMAVRARAAVLDGWRALPVDPLENGMGQNNVPRFDHHRVVLGVLRVVLVAFELDDDPFHVRAALPAWLLRSLRRHRVRRAFAVG